MRVTGRLQNQSVIRIPDEWFGKINPDTFVVHLTPYGVAQDLYVKTIDYGYSDEVISQSGTAINCFYSIEAEPLSEVSQT